MLDVREIGRAFVLAVCGTILVVGLFMLLIKAHPVVDPSFADLSERSATALALRHEHAPR
jgi:hypothetical protein